MSEKITEITLRYIKFRDDILEGGIDKMYIQGLITGINLHPIVKTAITFGLGKIGEKEEKAINKVLQIVIDLVESVLSSVNPEKLRRELCISFESPFQLERDLSISIMEIVELYDRDQDQE